MGANFSASELQQAQELLNRKLSGSRIINPGGRVGSAYQYLANTPEALRQLNALRGRYVFNVRQTELKPITITGSKETGGVITGTSKDIIRGIKKGSISIQSLPAQQREAILKKINSGSSAQQRQAVQRARQLIQQRQQRLQVLKKVTPIKILRKNISNRIIQGGLNKQQEINIKKKEETFIDKINKLSPRKTQTRRVIVRDLNKERDTIYSDISSLNQKYSGDVLSEKEYARYEKELAPILARYKSYSNKKTEYAKTLKPKQREAETEYDPVLNKDVLVLAPKDRRLSNKLDKSISKATTKVLQKGGKFSGADVTLTGLTVLKTGEEFVRGFTSLPKSIKEVIKNPRLLKNLPSAIKKEGEEFGTLLMVSPTSAFVKVGTNIVLMKGTDKVLRQISKLSSEQFIKLNPKYVGKVKTGAVLDIKTGQGKSVKLEVVGKIPKSSYTKQLGRAGKKVTAISTQADRLISLVKSGRVVRKPLGVVRKGVNKGKKVEDVLGKRAKSLLNRYDAGKSLTRKQLSYLDKSIRSKGSKGLLERSFFADPSGKIRPSRLGIQKEKKFKLLDYLTEDITFKKPKPQILLFENIKVQSFPKSLKSIANKIKKGKTLTSSESNKLLEFQLKKSGKFKPLGFVSAESEVTLPAGEIIKRSKKVGVVNVKGKNVPIVKASVYKPTGKIKTLLKKYKSGNITKKEIKSLDKQLKQKTGFDYGLSSKPSVKSKYVSIKRIGLSSSGKLSKKKTPSYTSKTLKPKSRISTIVPIKVKKPSSIKYKKGVSRKVVSPIKMITSKPSLARSLKSKSPIVRRSSMVRKSTIRKGRKPKVKIPKKKPTKVPAFNVYAKSGKKFIKITNKPLKREDALSRGTHAIDNTTSKQFKIVPVGKIKQVGKLPKTVQNYYNRAGYKLREFKVRKGRKFAIQPKYIERTRYGIDTRGEKKSLSISKYLKQSSKKKTSSVSKGRPSTSQRPTNISKRRTKASPSQLNALKKARRVLAQKRSKRRSK